MKKRNEKLGKNSRRGAQIGMSGAVEKVEMGCCCDGEAKRLRGAYGFIRKIDRDIGQRVQTRHAIVPMRLLELDGIIRLKGRNTCVARRPVAVLMRQFGGDAEQE